MSAAGITKIANIAQKLLQGVGFSNGCEEFALKNPPPFVPGDKPTGYSPTVSVVMNAPVPTYPGDFMQVARDDFDTIIDYAQHLAAFKMGGSDFLASVPLYQGMLRRAALYNGRLSAMGYFEKQMAELSQLEQERNPMFGELKPVDAK